MILLLIPFVGSLWIVCATPLFSRSRLCQVGELLPVCCLLRSFHRSVQDIKKRKRDENEE
jgi:hypothetical protein